jgi:hypothetical protein
LGTVKEAAEGPKTIPAPVAPPAHHDPLRHKLISHVAGVKQLQRPGVHGEGPRDVGFVGAPLQHPAGGPAEPKLTGQSEPGRAGPNDGDVNVKSSHRMPPISSFATSVALQT